jgi:hypothetical protein
MRNYKAFAPLIVVARGMKVLLLGKTSWRVRCSDTENARMVYCFTTDSCEQSGWLAGGGASSCAAS